MTRIYDWCVVGGGMTGLYAADFLAKRGLEVVLVEAAPFLGGVLSSRRWKSYTLDNGCHLLDFADPLSRAYYQELLGQAYHQVSVRYASKNGGALRKGIAVPDFSDRPEAARRDLLRSVRDAEPLPAHELKSLQDWLTSQFGGELAEQVAPSIENFAGVSPSELSWDAIEILSYWKRLRLDHDDVMQALKTSDPRLDERLAQSAASRAQPDSMPRNHYPHGGMGALCAAAQEQLERLGVDVRMSFPVRAITPSASTIELTGEQKLSARRVYWTRSLLQLEQLLGDPTNVEGLTHPLDVRIWAFELDSRDIVELTYIHDFSPDAHVFRSAALGHYSHQRDPQGRSVVLAEVYGDRATPCDELATRATWNGLEAMGQVRPGSNFMDHTSWFVRGALRLPLKPIGHGTPEPKAADLTLEPRILINPPMRGKNSIIQEVQQLLQRTLEDTDVDTDSSPL